MLDVSETYHPSFLAWVRGVPDVALCGRHVFEALFAQCAPQQPFGGSDAVYQWSDKQLDKDHTIP